MKRYAGIAGGIAAVFLVSAIAGPALALPAIASSTPPTSAGGTAAAAGLGIRLLDIPTDAQSDPRARAYIIDSLQPGTSIQRRVQIDNNTDTAQKVRVYPAAASITNDSFIGRNGATADQLSGWMSAGQPNLTIPAHQVANDEITIVVPVSATEGERYAAIWAQIRSAPSSEGGTSITSVSRVGIRVYLSVAAGNGPASQFTITSLRAQRNASGAPEVRAEVKNTGGRALDLSGALNLTDGPSGLRAGPFGVDHVTTLAPNSEGIVTVSLKARVPSGPWKAALTLTSGLLTHTAKAKISFGASATHPTSTAIEARPVGWIIAGIVLAALIAVTLVMWTIRRRRRISS